MILLYHFGQGCYNFIIAGHNTEHRLNQVKQNLTTKLKHKVMNPIQIEVNQIHLNQKLNKLLELTKPILIQFIDMRDIQLSTKLWNKNNLNVIDTYDLLETLKETLNFDFNMNDISISIFSDVRSLLYYLLQSEKKENG